MDKSDITDEIKKYVFLNLIEKLMILQRTPKKTFLIAGIGNPTEDYAAGYRKGIEHAIKGLITEFDLNILIEKKFNEIRKEENE